MLAARQPCPYYSQQVKEQDKPMLKRKKPALKRRRRLLDVASSRRRIKRNLQIKKVNHRRRSFIAYFQHLVETPAV